MLAKRSFEDIILLIDKLKKYNYNLNSSIIISNQSVLFKRSTEEELLMIDKINFNYSYSDMLDLFIDRYLLGRTILEDHFRIIDIVVLNNEDKCGHY